MNLFFFTFKAFRLILLFKVMLFLEILFLLIIKAVKKLNIKIGCECIEEVFKLYSFELFVSIFNDEVDILEI